MEPARPQTPVLCKPPFFSTPLATAKTTGTSSHLTDTRASNLWEHCRKHSKIWEEPSGTSKLLEAITRLGKQSAISSILKSKEYNEFMASVGKGASNEAQFHALAARAASSVYSNTSKSRVLFVRNGNDPFYSRFSKERDFNESTPSPTTLKPDFFTANVVQDKESHNYKPYSLYLPSQATCQPQYCEQPLQDEKSPSLQPLMLKPNKCFGYEDVRSLWELKSSTSEINITKWLKNLQLKATDVLRFQFHRRYVIGFLVAGVKIRVAIFSREGQFIGYPANYTNGTELVSCLVADLTASETGLGFPPEGVFVYSNPTQHVTISIPSVRGNEIIPFELLEQKLWPRRDCLLGRGTTIHTTRVTNSDKIYALKISSPYSKRPHEGSILHRLEDVPEVARILAYVEWPRSELQKHLYNIEWSNPAPATITSRSFRLTVTEWLPGSLQDKDLNLNDYLVIWKKLFLAVAHIGEQGFLHRDLSFGNVRVSRTKNNGVDDLEVKLIDFDLFDEVDNIGRGEASADRTGTTIFMPIEILATPSPPPRHEQHEDETAFWVVALAIFTRYFRNQFVQSLWSTESITNSSIKANFLLSFIFTHNSSWLEEPVEEFRAYVDFFRSICDTMVKVQFSGYAPNFRYPSVEERKDGKRMQQVEHLRINPLICQVLDSAINTLRAMNISDNNLTGMFQRMCIDNQVGNA